jgi:hypothetical protein
VSDPNVQRHLDGPKVLVGGSAQVRQAGVVQGFEGVSEDQADNSGKRVAE